MAKQSATRIALVTFGLISSIMSATVSRADGPQNSLDVSQVNSKDLMQGNDFYGIRTFQTTQKPDSILGWFQQNLPTIKNRFGDNQKDPDKLGISFSSELPMALLSSIRVLTSKVGETDSAVSYLCSSISDTNCAPSGRFFNSLRVDSVIGNCARNPDSACVEKISLTLADKSVVVARPTQEIPANTKTFVGAFDANGRGFPPGLSSWIWEADLPGAPNSRFLARGTVTTYAKVASGAWDYQKPTFTFELVPLSSEMAPVIAPRLENFKYKNTQDPVVRQVSIQPSCLAHDTNICYHRASFPQGSRATVTLQLPNRLTGWLNGRLVKPNVTTEPKNSIYDRVTVEAAPSVNIIAGGWVEWKKIPEKLFFNDDGTPNTMGVGRLDGAAGMYSGSVGAIEEYLEWQPYLGEKALLNEEGWTIASTVVESTDACANQSGLQGVVAANASAYSPGAPAFNKETQTLDYKVAAPHFAPDGKTENLGTYGLSMRADLVQCLYGVTEVPSRVEISITSATSGESKGSTVELSRNGNWVYLSAEGFTFSSPTLKVKLVQEKKAEPVAAPKVATPKVAAKKSITCTKGKIVRKVSGSNPKCPSGYKRK
ncbi:MAG: hypothetical protein EBX92_02290 [Actinobacteria bacterium]|nr:hypothetical protein [Actinomycetota bacterium]